MDLQKLLEMSNIELINDNCLSILDDFILKNRRVDNVLLHLHLTI